MKKMKVLFFALLMFFSVSNMGGGIMDLHAAESPQSAEYLPADDPGQNAELPYAAEIQPGAEKRVIVEYRASHDKSRRAGRRHRVKRIYRNIPAESLTVSPEEITEMENDPDILLIEEDAKISALGQTVDWGAEKILAPLSWDSGLSGKGVNIAVLDTGIATHSDLDIAGGISFDPDTASFFDDNGHGTYVAGIIAALDNDIGAVGVAPESSLYAVKVLNRDGEGYLSELLAGIDWCIENNMDIVNMSLGSDQNSKILEDMVSLAYSKGLLLVAAAGNSGDAAGDRDTTEYPAKYDGAIGVAATDISNRRAFFSSTGGGIDLSAPGVNIYTTALGNGYAACSGTSMSAPYVSGSLALLKQAYPHADNNSLRKILTDGAVPLGSPLWYGSGLVQAPVQESALEESPTASPTPPAVSPTPPAASPTPPAASPTPPAKSPTPPAASPSPAQGPAPNPAPPAQSPLPAEEPKYRILTEEPVYHARSEEPASGAPSGGFVFPHHVEPGIISVSINGKYIDFSKYNNVTPIVTEGRALLPLRAIAESLGLIVDWDHESTTVIVNTQESQKYFQKGKPGTINVLVNGKFVDFSQYDNISPIIMEGRTLLPIRAVAESLGLNIDWDPESMSIIIS